MVLSYLLLPFIRRHRHRYDQYLPLDRLSTGTTSLRHRIFDGVLALFVPTSWSRERDGRVVDGSREGGDEEESLVDAEEGEGMVGFDVDARRRQALERRAGEFGEGERRLSRELEEGFRDDSDEGEDNDNDEAGPEERHDERRGASGRV